mgnify:CR=1 FL=1
MDSLKNRITKEFEELNFKVLYTYSNEEFGKGYDKLFSMHNDSNLNYIKETKKFKERIRTHNSSHINNIDIVHIYETDYIDEVEKCLKNVLSTKQYRKRKEFYQIDLDILIKCILKEPNV